jgi:hypothetical protein
MQDVYAAYYHAKDADEYNNVVKAQICTNELIRNAASITGGNTTTTYVCMPTVVINTGIAQLLDAIIAAPGKQYNNVIESFIAMHKRYTTIAFIIRILEVKKGVFPDLVTHLFGWI